MQVRMNPGSQALLLAVALPLVMLWVTVCGAQGRPDIAAATAVNAQIAVHVQEAGGGTISVPTQVRLTSVNNPMGLQQMTGIGGVTTFNVAVGNYTVEVTAGGYRTA